MTREQMRLFFYLCAFGGVAVGSYLYYLIGWAVGYLFGYGYEVALVSWGYYAWDCVRRSEDLFLYVHTETEAYIDEYFAE